MTDKLAPPAVLDYVSIAVAVRQLAFPRSVLIDVWEELELDMTQRGRRICVKAADIPKVERRLRRLDSRELVGRAEASLRLAEDEVLGVSATANPEPQPSAHGDAHTCR